MYNRGKASSVRQQFWTTFGKYMSPIPSAEGNKVNWINYKTGIPHLFFRMDADKNMASISIQILHKDPVMAKKIYAQLELLRPFLQETLGEVWAWEQEANNEFDQLLSKIGTILEPVNVLKETDWPEIISFLKPRIIALDDFWMNHKMIIEMNV